MASTFGQSGVDSEPIFEYRQEYPFEMLIEHSSPLNNLPVYLHPREVLRIDGVRIAAQIISTELYELHRLLHEISFSERKPQSHLVFHACWSIIDNAHRFNRFVKSYEKAGMIQVNRIAQDILQKVEMLRHSHQHVDERVDEILVGNEQVLYGYISWVAREHVESSEGVIYSLVSGHYPYVDQNFTILNPAGRKLLNTIDLVTLEAIGKKRDKSYAPVHLEVASIGYAVKAIVSDIERAFDDFLAKRGPDRLREKDLLLRVQYKTTANETCEIQAEPEFLTYKPSAN